MLSAWINGKNKKVCKLSKRAVELLDSLKANGYEVVQAEVRFVVGWKGENDTEEYAIILPDIHLEKE